MNMLARCVAIVLILSPAAVSRPTHHAVNAQSVVADHFISTAHQCGVETTGKAVCWGILSQLAVPDSLAGGTYIAVAAGESDTSYAYTTCLIRRQTAASGPVVCWGNSNRAPAGSFTRISIGTTGGCGIRPSGSITCWINTGASLSIQTHTGHFLQVSYFQRLRPWENGACAISTKHVMTCWGAALKAGPPPGQVNSST